jgi:Kef-type K+ transport system membrane component KefB/nucleotide-binding universal stress UspA family protein
MDLFTAAPHHDVLVLIVQIALLLLTARALGEVALRLGQPAVLGEILAGILLGPSFLSSLVPAVGQWIVPQTAVQGYLLEVISLIGVVLLLLITGLETDIPLIRRHARTALSAASGGLILPLLSGFALGLALPDYLLGSPNERTIFALFVAAAMSISAIPVIAKVLIDLKLMRRDIGQTIIAAGMVDDTIAWVLLSIIIGLTGGGTISAAGLLQSVGSVLVFLLVSFTAGFWFVRRALNFVQDRITSRDAILTLVVTLAFAWGAVTQAIGLEALFGAFVAGILFGQMPRLPEEVIHKLESVTLAVFAPIFFAVAGLKVNLTSLFELSLIGWALLIIAVAMFGKIVGAYTGARLLGGRDHWTGLAYGAALNARGALGIIIATIGLNQGVLAQEMFSIIVIMAITTSLLAPPALRAILKNVQPEPAELRRLRQEELDAGSLVANIHRVLLPLRIRQQDDLALQTIEAQVLNKMGLKSKLSLTLLTVTEPAGRARGLDFLNQAAPLFARHELQKKVVGNVQPDAAILDEAQKGYDLLVFGASGEEKGADIVFTPLVDYLVRMSPCPTIVVNGERTRPGWNPRRILVPTDGSRASRHAVELAFALAAGTDDELVILHVVVDQTSRYFLDAEGESLDRQLEAGRLLVEELRDLGQLRGAHPAVSVQTGNDPIAIILDTARELKTELIILGTAVRPASARLYLGPRVERILKNASCPVIVFNS